MDEVEVLLNAMRAAGKVILDIQQRGFIIEKKLNNDIVTQADVEANNILKKIIMSAYPDDGWLSEESHDDMHRLQRERVWIVDPIDGTREFSSGIAEYAISVALVMNGIPEVASVYNPATNELFHAINGGGAWRGSQRLSCQSNEDKQKVLLLASRSEYARGEWAGFEKNYRVRQVGSIAYKLALIAAGNAQGTFSLGPKNEWDIAAGVLLVAEAGGVVTDTHRKQIQFNRKQVTVDGVVATVPEINNEIFAAIQQLKQP